MLGWFGRKGAPEVRPFVPVWLQGESVEAGGFVRGYEAQLDEVYRRNPVGLRAVRLVAGLVGALPLFAEEGDARAVELVRASSLMERAAAGLLLNGNAYVRLAVDGHDRPAELHCMRPERVSVACGADGWPSAYLYRAGGQVVRIARDDALGRRQVAHLKALNPGDDHYDRDRDYQAGQARASSGQAGLRAEHVELPAVLTAGEARQLAEADIARRWRASDRLKLRLPPSRMGLKAGDAIQLADEANVRSITAVSIDGMAVVIETEPAPAAIQSLPADGGRPVSEPDLPIGRSELLLFEAPADGVQPADTPRVWLAASNEGGWKRLPVELDLSDAPLPGTVLGRRAIVGHAETVLDARMPLILDELSTVTVRLINADQILMNADQEALAAGANLAILGDELIQFGRADRLSAGLFRLSKLLRGRRGTEWAADSHSAGEAFCLIDPAALAVVDLDAGAVGAALTATAHGIGDAAPLPQAARVIGGEAMRPPTPCHLQIDRAGNNVAARWVRRSYRNWAWIDGIGDRPDAFPERYRLTLNGSGGETVIETNIASVMIEAAQIPGEAGEPVQLSVATIGAAAVSRPARARPSPSRRMQDGADGAVRDPAAGGGPAAKGIYSQ